MGSKAIGVWFKRLRVIFPGRLAVRYLHCLFLFVICFYAWEGWAQCSSHVQAKELDKKVWGQLQQFVNEGHQPWRLDSYAVAGEEVLRLDQTPKEQWDVYGVPLNLVEQTERRAVYQYTSRLHSGTTHQVTVERPDWLLPSAKKWEWMAWVPVAVKTTRCR